MAAGQKLVVAVVMALAGVSVVHADMMPVGQARAVGPQSPPVCVPTSVQLADVSDSRTHCPGAADLDLASVHLFPEADAEMGHVLKAESLHILAYEPGSLNLCLYALISLGLCRSAPWVRKLSFGFIPDWYHSGGPFQIGHSHAVVPNCLCETVICFIQPDRTAEDLSEQYHRGTMVSLMRRSHFIPAVLGSRGPPLAC
jgi:hypothetical protein